MQVKADWFEYLHDFRRREFQRIFGHFGPGTFRDVLELGAGDGFQSTMLVEYAQRIVSTDIRQPPESGDPRIEVRAVSAEQIADAFPAGRFDLVYSSNMLEHVPDPPVVLAAVARVLADDGITIHVMPNRIWKACQVMLWIPNLVANALDDILRARSLRAVVARLRKPDEHGESSEKNNPTVVRPRRSLFRKVLLPEPHGVSLAHRAEFAAFARRRWVKELRQAGFDVIAVLRGPFSSGYGFGTTALTRLLERCGVSSEYIFVAKKAGATSPHARAFTGAASG